MANISLDLNNFKSAGVYTVEIDNTERIVVNTQALRLVPGFSTTGLPNAPVFIRSTKDRAKYFGDIDKKLERKGSFFHRMIDTCLLSSPVFAINLLKPFMGDDEYDADSAQFLALGLDSGYADNDQGMDWYTDAPSAKYVEYFNRQRFWTPDKDKLQGVITNFTRDITRTPFFQLTNLSTKKYSFIIRKAQGLSQYSVFAKDWYGSVNNIPYEWIRPYDYIKDYFIQIIAIEGDWTNYTQLSTDPYYSQYFNANGIIASKLDSFLNGVTRIGAWTGCIIPDFKDNTGTEQYIETIVNASTPLTGILLNINQELMDLLNWNSDIGEWVLGDGEVSADLLIDLVGHNLIDSSDISTGFLSYDLHVDTSTSYQFHYEISIALIDPDSNDNSRKFYISNSNDASLLSVGSLVVKASSSGIPDGVTYITNKYYDYDEDLYIAETAENVENGTLMIQAPIDHPLISTHYKFYRLNGLAINNRHLPGFDTDGAPNVESGVTKIYSMLEDPGINRGLINKEMINYRYIVDTMANGLQPEMGGKFYLSRLAKKRGKTTAILNAPSITRFAASTNPYFCDTFVSGVDVPNFSTEWIPQGGNPDMPRSFRFTLPSEENGAKYCGVFGPYFVYNDNGKALKVPPAADVSNAYIRKFLGGDPYAIVANRNGIISNPNIMSLEYMIDKYDRDFLEPFGYNSIIQKSSTNQFMIYSNSTAFQSIGSDFNYLHVRELLNTLEITIEEKLEPYVFTFNNPITRLKIINNITPDLEALKDAGAIYKYEIIMDDTNNSTELIEEGFGIIDVMVWITGALTKIINRIQVNRNTGQISSGGFLL